MSGQRFRKPEDLRASIGKGIVEIGTDIPGVTVTDAGVYHEVEDGRTD